MAALVMGVAGGSSGRNVPAVPPRFELRARSREFLRRGLVLSGALHLALLFTLLNLHGSGEEVVPTYGRAVDIFRQPTPRVIALPPPEPGAPPVARPSQGVFQPVGWDIPEMPAIQFDGIPGVDGPARPGPVARGPRTDGPAPPNPQDVDRVYPVNQVEVPPVPIESPKPPYPDIAREAAITGRVLAVVLVRADGTVAQVTASGNRILCESVEKTLYRWRFRPAKTGGRAVQVRIEIPVVFTL